MNLKKIYGELLNKISSVDFQLLWSGFSRTKFAIYNDSEVCFDGEIIPKTSEFIANTAIIYKGERIAIWNIDKLGDMDILASKMIHEMFHAFQQQCDNCMYPNEMQATLRYEYSAENMSIKYRENLILSALSQKFDREKFQEFCALRKYRTKRYPYEIDYETKVEWVEGSANYVELCALAQLSREKYEKKLQTMLSNLQNKECLFPVRILSYDVGCLLIKLFIENEMGNTFSLNGAFSSQMIEKANACEGIPIDIDVEKRVEDYHEKTRAMIRKAIDMHRPISIEGGRLVGYNVYNARYMDGFLLTTYFMAYEIDGEEHILNGDFVVEIDQDRNIKNIYQTNLSLEGEV